VKVNVDSKVL
jgi:hypothetical protein